MKACIIILLCLSTLSCKKYDSKELYDEELYIVEVDGYKGLVDKNDNIVTPISYNNIHNFSGETILVESSGKKGLYDKKGNVIIPPYFNSIGTVIYDNSLFLAFEQKPNFGCYLYNRQGERISKKYSRINIFSEGLAVAQYETDAERSGYIFIKAGFIDTTGTEVIPFVFNYANSFSSGLAAVNYQGKWGYINKKGKEVIPFQFERARSFNLGNQRLIAAVRLDNKWGFIDDKGKLVIPFKYDYVGDCFDLGVIEVQVKAERYFINENDQCVDRKKTLTDQNRIKDWKTDI